jgi:GntR family transcriptional repressor for pyruvate dehydrogenase complex
MRASLDDPNRYAEADFAFHRVLLEATGNRVLIRMAEPIRQLLEYSLHTTDSVGHRLERALHDHEMIERAVRRRQSESARAAMRKHLERTERDVEAFARAERPA